MDTSIKLYATEPHSERLQRWLCSMVSTIIAFYWAIFRLWGYLLLSLLAVACVLAGASEISLPTHRWYLAIPSITLGVAFFISDKVRRFAWATLGLAAVWFLPVTIILTTFFDPEHRIESPVLSLVVLALYVVPPLVGAMLVIHAKRR